MFCGTGNLNPNFGKPSKGLLIYVFVVITVALLIIPDNITNHIKITAASPLAPFQKMVSYTGNFFKSGFRTIAVMMESANEDEKLREKVFLLQNKIINQQNAINMLDRKLKTVLEFKENIDINGKPLNANVIGYDTSNHRRSILIDIGKKQGVAVNDTVVYGNSLVGRISAAGHSVSRVMLITDPASNVPSRFLESREQGIVKGLASNVCIIRYVPRYAKVKKNDKVFSSGIGEVYPKSVYIGEVSEVRQKSAKLFKNIKLKPRVDFSKIEHVLVIKKNKIKSIRN